jgi:putative ABC transport system permease protein
VKYLRLVVANLGRHKLRTVLTILSVALALFLFASLRSVTTTLAASAQFGGARRLVTLNATGLVFPLPLAYGNRIKTLPGVTGLSWTPNPTWRSIPRLCCPPTRSRRLSRTAPARSSGSAC